MKAGRTRCGRCNNVLAGAGSRGLQAHERKESAAARQAFDDALAAGPDGPAEVRRRVILDYVPGMFRRRSKTRHGEGAYIADDDSVYWLFHCSRCSITYRPGDDYPQRLEAASSAGHDIILTADDVR